MARATGRSFRVVVREPYHLTLFEYLQLLEAERIEGVLDRFRSINEAGLMSLAFNEPKKLRDELDAAMDAAGMLPTREQALAKGQAIIDMVRRIDEQRALAESTGDTTGDVTHG